MPEVFNSYFRIKFYNGHSDLLGWNKSTELTVMSDIVTYLKDKGHFHGNKKVAVVIDSISPVILYRSIPYTCQTIHRLADTQCIGMKYIEIFKLCEIPRFCRNYESFTVATMTWLIVTELLKHSETCLN